MSKNAGQMSKKVEIIDGINYISLAEAAEFVL